jgi:tRNA dimethylallyltransferase
MTDLARNAARPILIAGPTASGKSGLALAIAERVGGVIINADSMQVYDNLSTLTARPTAEDEARVPHRLYGHISGHEAYSVARWVGDVDAVLVAAHAAGQRPIIVGGTGLYFKALLEGLSPVPAIPADIRSHWRDEAARISAAELHAKLAEVDPVMADRIEPTDRQRVTRALEVFDATGISLDTWQKTPGQSILDTGAQAGIEPVRLVVTRPRWDLHARCDQRFDAIMAGGALDEVRALLAEAIDLDYPVMRALGVRPLADHLAEKLSLETAVEQAKAETRQYVKRQETWLTRNMMSWEPVNLQQNDILSLDIDHLIDG